MKPTQLAELFANIRATIVSFFSILMFVALGVGIFAGIYWMAPALQATVDSSFNEGAFHHFQIQFPYGLTESDLGKLRDVEGVTDVEASYLAYAEFVANGEKRTAKLQMVGERIDTLRVLEGALPTKAGEIALKETSAQSLELQVGDTITFSHDNSDGNDKDGMELLTGDTYTITALVESPEYLALSSRTYGFSTTGDIDDIAWMPAAAFDSAAFLDGHPVANVRCESLASLNSFGDDYGRKSAPIVDGISELGSTLAPTRYDEVHDNAQKQVDDAEAKIADAKKKISDGEKQVKENEAKLAQARIDLDEAVATGEAKLAEAYEKLQAGEKAKADAEKKLSSARSMLNQARDGLDDVDHLKSDGKSISNEMKSYKAKQDKLLADGKITQEQYNANLDKEGARVHNMIEPIARATGRSAPNIDHTNYSQTISTIDSIVDNVDNMKVTVEGQTFAIGEARSKLAEYQEKVSDAQSKLNKKSKELANAWDQYYAGQSELETKKAEGEKAIADGEAEIDKAKKQIEKGKAEVASKEVQLAEAKEKVAALKKYDWVVTPRSYNGGAAEASVFAGMTDRLSFSMAALFVIVGLLVSYSAVSRIVHEQVTQIGTKKALGLRSHEITLSFLAYAAIAVFLGSIVGLIVGVIAVEGIIGKAIAKRFLFDSVLPYFDWRLALIATAIELVLVLGATWAACGKVLREHAIELLKGEKPPSAKTRFFEKWGIWERLPLYTQTIVNNCLNDRRRVFSTVVGVAGCTALIVTAVTLNNDVLASYDKQYQEVYGFDTVATVDNQEKGAVQAVEQVLEKAGFSSVNVMRQNQVIKLPSGERGTIRLVVPEDDEAFSSLYHVVPIGGGSADLSADGAWVSEAYASHMGAKVGDELVVNSPDGTTHSVPIAGFDKFYLVNFEMVMSREAYERIYDTQFVANSVLINREEASIEELDGLLAGVTGYEQVYDDKAGNNNVFVSFASVSRTVVAVYLVLSILMAVVVLLNLNVMFIEEKKRELIVLMINGFSTKDAKRYIYNDTIVLTILGIVVGIALGVVMGSLTVGSVEPTSAFFYKGVDWVAVAAGAGMSALLALVMSVIALRRIPAFNLTDINRF